MPTYPSSLLLGVAPGTRSVNNYTSRFEFRFDNEPTAVSSAGFALSAGTGATLQSSPSYSNGVLTGSGSTTFFVDGTFYTDTATTVLVKDQANAIQNGVYYLSKAGSASTYWQLTRDTRFDEDAEIKRNSIFSVASGTVNASTKWYISSSEPMVIGTDSITFSALGTTVLYPSAAHYPTDVNVGTSETTNATQFIADFRSMLNTIQYDISGLETSFASVSTEGLKWMASSNILTLHNVYKKFKKISLEMSRLKADIDRMNTVGFSATFPGIGLTSTYPSGKNRLTNTAGGY
jgi:hypothetical protein